MPLEWRVGHASGEARRGQGRDGGTPRWKAIERTLDEEVRKVVEEGDMGRLSAKTTLVRCRSTTFATSGGAWVFIAACTHAAMASTPIVPAIRRLRDRRVETPSFEVEGQPLTIQPVHIRDGHERMSPL